MNKNLTFSFIGFGLIGGTIAKALRKLYPDSKIMAYNYRNTPHPSLEKAKQDGNLSHISTTLSEAADADVILLCAPVIKNVAYLEQIAPLIRKDTLVTDVGSVKGNIVKKAIELNIGGNFLGAHPMAGREKVGYENSDDKMLENATFIITPNEYNTEEQVEFLKDLFIKMKAKPLIMDPTVHDSVTAGISHGPHIVSASLVNTISNRDNPEDGLYLKLAAGGFKDITRISSSSPEMWRDICLANKTETLNFIDEFTEILAQVKASIESEDGDKIYEFFDTARQYREGFNNV
ncbi:MAG: prephenate dehydrogenase/arogenate dehydrogenase family protein [Lachnospiraceae bacterium]|nr:prephenate dehydrogenase/arogenate dehydrogenase family protein [Lachnospiraceae bacterium]